jgi:hypothetical protein
VLDCDETCVDACQEEYTYTTIVSDGDVFSDFCCAQLSCACWLNTPLNPSTMASG